AVPGSILAQKHGDCCNGARRPRSLLHLSPRRGKDDLRPQRNKTGEGNKPMERTLPPHPDPLPPGAPPERGSAPSLRLRQSFPGGQYDAGSPLSVGLAITFLKAALIGTLRLTPLGGIGFRNHLS